MKPQKQPDITSLVSNFMASTHRVLASRNNVPALFTLGQKTTLVDADVGNISGILPVFAWFANDLHRGVTGYPLGISYKKSAKSLTGFDVNFGACTEPTSELLLYLVESMCQAMEVLPVNNVVYGAVQIDGLLNEFINSMNVTFAPAIESQHSKITNI